MIVGRISERERIVRARDSALDRIDLELEGLARIRCEDYCASLRGRGFDVSGIRPLVARPWESRTEQFEIRRARAALDYAGVPQIPGRRGLVRRAVGEVIGVR